MLSLAAAISTKPSGDVASWTPSTGLIVAIGVVIALSLLARILLSHR